KQRLGISTASGMHIVHSGTLEQRGIYVPPGALNRPYIENRVQGMAGDDAGNIFLLSSSGFYHFNSRGELVFRYDHYKKEDADKVGVPFGRHDGLITSEPGILLLATTAGQYIYHISKKEFHSINEKDELLYQQIAPTKDWIHFMHSRENSFSVIAEGAKELAWFDLVGKKKYKLQTTLTGLDKLFGWRSKITRLNDSTFIITAMQKGFYLLHFNKQTNVYEILPEIYLPGYLCRSVFLDKQSRLWIATDRGLLRQKKNAGNLEKLVLPTEKNEPGRAFSVSTATVAGNKLFIGTLGAGVYVFDCRSLQFLKHIDLSKVRATGSANNISSLLPSGNDSIYAGTYGPLTGINVRDYEYKTIKLQQWDDEHDYINCQLLGSDKTWYIATSKSNLFYYRRSNQKSFTLEDQSKEPFFRILAPMRIAEDPKGNIWFAGHGASRFNIHKRQFDLLIDSFPKIRTARKEVDDITFDKKGKMYLALSANGLAVYDPVQKTFEHITRSNGLPDNTIRTIYLHNDKLWLGTERGLASYDIITKKIFSFGLADDMPEGAFTSYKFYYDSIHKHLYGGFNNTIVRFNPDSLSKNNALPEFFIESIQVPGESTIHHPKDRVELSYKRNSMVLSLASINFEDAYQQLFAYRFIKDGSEAWLETGSQRKIIFSSLSSGMHRLQVKVFIKNNSWPDQVSEIDILVHPPFWRRGWFIILCGLLLIASVWLGLRARVKNIRQKEKINTQLAELEMKALHVQMNPHFIFNSLNSIKEMILQDEKQHASRYLSKFAQLIRTNLEQSKQTFITVKQCINHLQQYLEMEKIRFEDFSYSIHIGDDLDIVAFHMPPMLIQPLVENAIWHGLRNKNDEKKLDIRFVKEDGQLICEIEDNGIGYLLSLKNKSGLQPVHRSLGIANIYERLELMNEKYDVNCSLTIKDKSELPGRNGSGTIATLKFNLNK
ncbi:MAG TPA: histidine kinase, partial [Agriterribacter sp.]|nr:histidine kinase [Agriterribacter sp.]